MLGRRRAANNNWQLKVNMKGATNDGKFLVFRRDCARPRPGIGLEFRERNQPTTVLGRNVAKERERKNNFAFYFNQSHTYYQSQSDRHLNKINLL